MEYQGKKRPLKKKVLSKRKKKPHQNPIKLCCYGISRGEKKLPLKKNSLKRKKETLNLVQGLKKGQNGQRDKKGLQKDLAKKLKLY
jgi:hypothetical protein